MFPRMSLFESRFLGFRLIVDAPTDLPDGAEAKIVVIDDNLTPEERVALHASLDQAMNDSEVGHGMDVAST